MNKFLDWLDDRSGIRGLVKEFKDEETDAESDVSNFTIILTFIL